MFTIHSDRLTVGFAEPNVENLTSRFNRAGFITSVVLDGKTEFCGDERGGTHGAGLCSEITTDSPSREAGVGELFPKFGVGLIKKPDELPYMFMRPYEADPFEIRYELYGDRVAFETDPKPASGYALREKKTVSVTGNVLRVDYEVENTGEKAFEYSEYCHNFLNLEYDGVTNGFNLTMDAGNAGYPYGWLITFFPSRHKITARDYFAPHHHNIWSPGFVISPEVYYSTSLAPGGKAVYAREWEFETMPPLRPRFIK